MADPFSFAISTVAQIGIGYLFPSEGPRLKDLKVSASTYGSAIPEVFGTCRVGANMIWSNPIREKKKKKMAGKGGGFYNEYTYYVDFAMALCRGPVAMVRRLWFDGKLIYDATGASEGVQTGKYRFRIYNGGEDQMPDALIEQSKGVGNAPAYRDLCYVVFDNLPLKDFGNRIPQMAAEVFVEASGAGAQGVSVPIDYFPVDAEHPLDDRSAVYAADFDRGFIYMRAFSPSGLRRFRMSDGVEDRQILASDMGAADDLGDMLGVAADGGILTLGGSADNYVPLLKFDPVSFQLIGTHGAASSGDAFGGLPRNGIFSAVSGSYYGHYARLGYGTGKVSVFSTAGGLSFINDADFGSPGGIAGPGDGSSTFYLLDNFGSSSTLAATSIKVNRYTPATGAITMIGEVTASDLGLAGGTRFSANGCVWDGADPGLLILVRVTSGDVRLVKFSTDSETVAWQVVAPGLSGATMRGGRLLNGEFCWVSSNRLYAISTVSGVFIDRDADFYVNPEDDPGTDYDDGDAGVAIDISGVSTANQAFDCIRNCVIAVGGGTDAIVRIGAAATPGTTLAWIVESMLRKGGMTSKDFDLTALAAVPVRGYGWASGTDIKSILDELRRVYLFDLVESNGRLVAKLRGDEDSDTFAVLTTIPQDALGSSGEEAMDFWKETRLSEADLPERVSLTYMNADDDFEASTAHSQRIADPLPTMWSRQQVAMQINLVLTPTEAKNMVNKMLYAQWSERTKHETRLPWAYLNLDPSDLVKVRLNDGRTYVERIHQTEFGANYAIEVESYGQDSGSYESEAVGDGGGAGRPDIISLSKPAQVFVFNTPLLRDVDDTGGGFSRYYTTIASDAPGVFNGATVFKSSNGQDYDDLYADTNECEWAAVGAPVPPASHGVWGLDWETRITLYPGSQEFEIASITDDELWAGGNLAVIGQEVIQFRDAEQNADGTWVIYNLLRGRRGTEYAHDTHVAGERFIFLSETTIELQGDLIDARGQDRYFKGVGNGRSLVDAPVTQLVYEPRDLMPYAVADLRREINSDGSIDLSWERRTRLGGNMMDGTGEVPLNEANERYEVYVLSAPFDGDVSRGLPPETFVRKYEVTSPWFTYSAIDSLADGFDSNLDTMHVVIYQMSAAVGRGFPSARSIEPWREW